MYLDVLPYLSNDCLLLKYPHMRKVDVFILYGGWFFHSSPKRLTAAIKIEHCFSDMFLSQVASPRVLFSGLSSSQSMQRY